MFVGAYEGEVVRAADAARLVVAMPESGDETATPFDAAAYETPPPAVYRYRQDTATGQHTGLVCLMSLAAFADGRVRGHEQVLPGRVAALVEHLASGDGRIELVTALHDPGPRFRAALADDGEPRVDVTTSDGVRHRIWALPPDVELLAEMSTARHYLADGHHRVAASRHRWETTGHPESLAVVSFGLDGLDLTAHPGASGPAPTLAEVMALADAGRTVAPKTTAFRPKPASGLFVRR